MSWYLQVMKLRHLAEQKGISQVEIARRTGMQQSNVSRVLGERFVPKLDTFLAIAEAIGYTISFKEMEIKHPNIDTILAELKEKQDMANESAEQNWMNDAIYDVTVKSSTNDSVIIDLEVGKFEPIYFTIQVNKEDWEIVSCSSKKQSPRMDDIMDNFVLPVIKKYL